MLIGGLQKMTLIDYPGKIAATIFTVGCGFRCHFCHNPELELFPQNPAYQKFEEKVLNFLRARTKLIDAVCITGGEPTLQKDLIPFIKEVKSLGYSIKLDTNGSGPEVLQKLIELGLVDFFAMDIKAPWSKYELVVGRKVDLAKIQQSAKIITSSGLPHEFRSTVLPELHSSADIIQMARQVKGADSYHLQQFKSAANLVNPEFTNKKTYSKKELEDIRSQIKGWFKVCKVR